MSQMTTFSISISIAFLHSMNSYGQSRLPLANPWSEKQRTKMFVAVVLKSGSGEIDFRIGLPKPTYSEAEQLCQEWSQNNPNDLRLPRVDETWIEETPPEKPQKKTPEPPPLSSKKGSERRKVKPSAYEEMEAYNNPFKKPATGPSKDPTANTSNQATVATAIIGKWTVESGGSGNSVKTYEFSRDGNFSLAIKNRYFNQRKNGTWNPNGSGIDARFVDSGRPGTGGFSKGRVVQVRVISTNQIEIDGEIVQRSN